MFAPGVAHFSFVTNQISSTRQFYVDVLGAEVLGDDRELCELRLHGHQLILRSGQAGDKRATPPINLSIAEHAHVGLVVDLGELDRLERSCRSVECSVTERVRRREGTPFEHECFFVFDPDGRVWELKAFVAPNLGRT